MSSIQLIYDSTSIETINSYKVMVAVPLLYVFLTHYLFQILCLIKGNKDNIERLNDLGRRLFLFGITALFSMNFIQGSIVTAIIAWIALISTILCHCFIFLRETGQKYHNITLVIFYGMLMIWFGTSVAFYVYEACS